MSVLPQTEQPKVTVHPPDWDGTSEHSYNIMRQPNPCCPLINAAIETIQRCQKLCRDLKNLDEDELRDRLNDIDNELCDLVPVRKGMMEAIRTRVEEIRQWGQEWKDEAKRHQPG